MRRKKRPHRPVVRGGVKMLQCRDCDEWKGLEQFAKGRERKDGSIVYSSYCRPCARARAGRYYRAKRKRRPRETDDPFVGCKICHYATRRENLDAEGVCPECRAFMDVKPQSIDSGKGRSHNNPGHEARMEIYAARVAKRHPLFT